MLSNLMNFLGFPGGDGGGDQNGNNQRSYSNDRSGGGDFPGQGSGLGMEFGWRGPEVYSNVFRAFSWAFMGSPEKNASGKLMLPQSALEVITTMNVPYPLLFRIDNCTERASIRRIDAPSSRLRVDEDSSVCPPFTHAGSPEFGSLESCIILPMWMFERIGLEDGDSVRVQTVALPRGTFAKFKFATSDYAEFSNLRAVLEIELKNYSTLTRGDCLMIMYLDDPHFCRVMELRDDEERSVDAVHIINTDLRVEFDEPDDVPLQPLEETVAEFGDPFQVLVEESHPSATTKTGFQLFTPPEKIGREISDNGDESSANSSSTLGKAIDYKNSLRLPENHQPFSGSGRKLRERKKK